MECTIAALIACFSIYVDTGLLVTDVKYAEVKIQQNQMTHVAKSYNPYGKLAFGVEARPSERLAASLACGHDSSLATGKDRGEYFCEFNARWYLFGRRR